MRYGRVLGEEEVWDVLGLVAGVGKQVREPRNDGTDSVYTLSVPWNGQHMLVFSSPRGCRTAGYIATFQSLIFQSLR